MNGDYLNEDTFPAGFLDGLDNDDSIEMESDDLLASIHYSLLMENINDQMNDSLKVNHVNFVLQYEARYAIIYAKFQGTEHIQAIIAARQETYNTIIQTIAERFGLLIDNIDEAYIPIVGRCLYNFYVFGFVNHLTVFLTNIILANRKSIAMDFKNVQVNSNNSIKKILKDKNDLYIFNNIFKVITEHIPSMPIGSDYFTYILPYYNAIEYVELARMLDSGMIMFNNSCYDLFLRPLLSESGYGFVINAVQTSLYERLTSSNMPVTLEGKDGADEEVINV